jgi:hypothetical protein
MENNAGGKNEAISPQEESAKAAILAECDKLAKAGVTFVAVHFTKMDMALATSAPLETGGRE